MSGPPFLVYRELLPSTSVSFASFFTGEISCTNTINEYLLVATTSTLSVYQVDHGKGRQSSLRLCTHFHVFGKLQDVAVFKFKNNSQQRIMINVDLGKVLILEFDPLRNKLFLKRMINAEEAAFGVGSEVAAKTNGRSICSGLGSEPKLSVDEVMGLACQLLYGNQFMFMPLKSHNFSDAKSQTNQFIVNILQQHHLVGTVIDLTFIDGFSHPALAILQESGPLPIGHAAKVLHTCTLTVIAIDVPMKSAAVLWQRKKLPHDSICLLRHKNSNLMGTVVVISMNAVIVVGEQHARALATNGFAATTVHSSIRLQLSLLSEGLELDASRWIMGDDHALVGSLKTGQLLSIILMLPPQEEAATQSTPLMALSSLEFDAEIIGSTIRSSCLCASSRGDFWFLGSRSSDCLLLSVKTAITTISRSGVLGGVGVGGGGGISFSFGERAVGGGRGLGSTPGSSAITPLVKRQRRSPRTAVDREKAQEHSADMAAEEMLIFGCSLSHSVGLVGAAGAASFHSVTAGLEEGAGLAIGKPFTPSSALSSRVGLAAGPGTTGRATSSSRGARAQAQSQQQQQWEAQGRVYDVCVIDSIPVLGPAIAGIVTSADDYSEQMNKIDWQSNRPRLSLPTTAEAYINPKIAKNSLMLSTGLDGQAALGRVSMGLRMSKISSRNFDSASCALSVQAPSQLFTLLFITIAGRTRLFQTSGQIKEGQRMGAQYVVSTADLSMTEYSPVEVGFMALDTTVAVGVLSFESDVVVQVCSEGLRVSRLVGDSVVTTEALQDVLMGESEDTGGLGGELGESIVSADIDGHGWIVILTSLKRVHLMRFDAEEDCVVSVHSAAPLPPHFPSVSFLLPSSATNDVESATAYSTGTLGTAPSLSLSHPAKMDTDSLDSSSPMARFVGDELISVTLFYGSFPQAFSMAPIDEFTVSGAKEGKEEKGTERTPKNDSDTTPTLTSPRGPFQGSPRGGWRKTSITPVVVAAIGGGAVSRQSSLDSSEGMIDGDNSAGVATAVTSPKFGDDSPAFPGLEAIVRDKGGISDEMTSEEVLLYSCPLSQHVKENDPAVKFAGLLSPQQGGGAATGEVEVEVARLNSTGPVGFFTPSVSQLDAVAQKRIRSSDDMGSLAAMAVDNFDTADSVVKPGGVADVTDDFEGSEGHSTCPDGDNERCKDEDGLHLVFGDVTGRVTVVRAADWHEVFTTQQITHAPEMLPFADVFTASSTAHSTSSRAGSASALKMRRGGSGGSGSSGTGATVSSHDIFGLQCDDGSTLASPRHLDSGCSPYLRSSSDPSSSPRTAGTAGSKAAVSDRMLMDVRVTRLVSGGSAGGSSDNSSSASRSASSSDNSDRDRLCLVAIFDSGDVVVYYAKEEGGYAGCFTKLNHTVVTRRPKNKAFRLRRGTGTGGDGSALRSSVFGGAEAMTIASEERRFDTYGEDGIGTSWPKPWVSNGSGGEGSVGTFHTSTEILNSFKLHCTDDILGGSAVLIPGTRPCVLVSHKGLPQLIPLGFPELPYSNAGAFSVAPLHVRSVSGTLTLWQEFEGNQSRRVFGMYQAQSDDCTYPGSIATLKKVHAGMTVHFCVEVKPVADLTLGEEIENALLKKKTVLLACSEIVETPFLSSVLTEEEIQKEQEQHDRFFNDLNSFCQPDTKVGPAPKLQSRRYKLVLMQGGSAVDVYTLPENEEVLGIEVLHFDTEKPVDPSSAQQFLAFAGQPPAPILKKRVFIAASTLVTEKHGEDTQGEGRLLVLSLDYKQLVVEDDSSAGVGTDTSESIEQPLTSSAAGGANSSGSGSGSSSGTAEALAAGKQSSSAQAQFLESILPKLKMHWQGPGPATIVKQFGDGHVVSTIGSHVYVYRMNRLSMELEQAGFYFAQNYILLADVCNSVTLLAWRSEDCCLRELAKDFDNHIALSTAFVVDKPRLGVVVGDAEGNLQLLQFNPKNLESKKGSRLLNLAEFHLGTDANLLLAYPLLTPPPPPPSSAPISLLAVGHMSKKAHRSSGQALIPFEKTLDKGMRMRTGTLVGGVDGSLGVLIPLDEKMYRRLMLLQQLMCVGVYTPFGLSPTDYRTAKTTRFRLDRKKGVLDGTLLWKYASLPLILQTELAAVMGSTSDIILENLSRLDFYCTSF